MGKVLVCWGFEGDLHGLIAKNIGERLIFNGIFIKKCKQMEFNGAMMGIYQKEMAHPRLTVGCMVNTMMMRLIFEPTETWAHFFDG